MAKVNPNDTYDPALFNGVIQGDTAILACTISGASTYYYKKPDSFGDATVYNITLTVGLPFPVIIPVYTVLCEDAALTTPVTAGKVMVTHLDARQL